MISRCRPPSALLWLALAACAAFAASVATAASASHGGDGRLSDAPHRHARRPETALLHWLRDQGAEVRPGGAGGLQGALLQGIALQDVRSVASLKPARQLA